MIEVDVRDFQSIEHVNLKVEGFTALVGRSNLGKSALVRAVKAALTGASVSSFVRHGKACLRKTKKAKSCKCFAAVHLKAEGFDLLWQKGDAINRYTFNGTVYDKAEKGTPDFLSTPFLPVKVGDKQTLLQVADQFSAIFLLDQTGGVVADVLSDVARLDRINVAMRMVEKDRKEAVNTRKVREKDVVDLTGKLQRYDNLDAAVSQSEQVVRDLAKLEKAFAEVERIDHFLTTGTTLIQRVKVLQTATQIECPDPTIFAETQMRLLRLTTWIDLLSEYTSGVDRLMCVEAVDVPEKGRLWESVELLGTFAKWHAQLVVFRDWFNARKPIEALPALEPGSMRALADELLQQSQWVARKANIEASIQQLEQEWQEMLVEEKAAHDEVEELGVCPTCIRPLRAT